MANLTKKSVTFKSYSIPTRNFHGPEGVLQLMNNESINVATQTIETKVNLEFDFFYRHNKSLFRIAQGSL